MREFNYLWLSAAEICKRLGLATSCFQALTTEERERIPKLGENIRTDIALHLLRPEQVGSLCESCLKPLTKTQTRYCGTICRNTHIVGRDIRTQALELVLTNDFVAQILKDSHQADLPLEEFVKIALEFGRHQVLLFQRTGSSGSHELEEASSERE